MFVVIGLIAFYVIFYSSVMYFDCWAKIKEEESDRKYQEIMNRFYTRKL